MDLISGMMLRSGRDLELTPNVSVSHPTTARILEINNGFMCEEYYWTYVFSLLSDPYDFMVYLDDNGIDYEKVSAFDVFILRWNDAQKDQLENFELYQKVGSSPLLLLNHSLAFFFGSHHFCLKKLDGQIVLADADDEAWFVTKDGFDLVVEFITKMNCIERDDKIKPATPGAKKVLIEDKRREEKKRARQKPKEEKAERIAEAMAAIDAGVGLVDSYDNLPIYRLLSTAHSVQKRIVVQSMLNGIYTGMLKADDVPEKSLRWV